MSLTIDEVPVSPTFLTGQLEYTPGMGHKVLAARLLYRRPKQTTQIRAACMVMEFDADQEHEAVSRNVIKQVDALIQDLPTEMSSLQEPCSCCPSDASCLGNGTCEVGRKLLEVMSPWLIYGTKDCGHVITHSAKCLFEYALHGLRFGITAARLIKSIHEEQVMKLREAKELKSKPHSIRRVILNLVQGQFYSRPMNLAEERVHHQSSLHNVMFIGQLLVHDLLVDSAIHESLTELLRPRNRPDALGQRLEMACCLLAVAGRRLDQGVSMEAYYTYMERLVQSPEVGVPLKEMFAGLLVKRAAWLLADAKEPKTP